MVYFYCAISTSVCNEFKLKPFFPLNLLSRIIVVQSETFSGEELSEDQGGFDNTNSGTIKASPNLASQVTASWSVPQQDSSSISQSEFHHEVNLYILAGHENMQL